MRALFNSFVEKRFPAVEYVTTAVTYERMRIRSRRSSST